MRADVRAFVSKCDSCQRVKASNALPPGKLMPLEVPSRPWESISMDFITCLPRVSPGGFDAILVVVDRLTKLAHFIATTTAVTAEEVAHLLRARVFSLHGVPCSIVSDRDPRFTAAYFAGLCELLGVKQSMSSAYHPQSDGQTERMNRTLEDMLRHYVSPSQTDWAAHLDVAEFAYNNARQESTQETPFYLNYGFHPLSPIDLMLRPEGVAPMRPPVRGYTTGAPVLGGEEAPARAAEPSGAADVQVARAQRVAKVREKLAMARVPAAGKWCADMQDLWSHARTCLRAAQDRQKTYADKRRGEVPVLEPGTFVLLKTTNLRLKSTVSSKLTPRWVGPFKVKRAVNPVAFELELPESMARVHPVFHASSLKPYKTDREVPLTPLPLEVEGELEYEVDCVLAERKARRRVEYLVRWAGLGPEHDSWEPAANLKNCPLVMKAYKEKQRLEAGLGPLLGSAGSKRPPSPVTVDDPPAKERKTVSVSAAFYGATAKGGAKPKRKCAPRPAVAEAERSRGERAPVPEAQQDASGVRRSARLQQVGL
jgi:hypothetical protein